MTQPLLRRQPEAPGSRRLIRDGRTLTALQAQRDHARAKRKSSRTVLRALIYPGGTSRDSSDINERAVRKYSAGEHLILIAQIQAVLPLCFYPLGVILSLWSDFARLHKVSLGDLPSEIQTELKKRIPAE